MCFSPEASFSAAAVVTTIGFFSRSKAESTELKNLALIPICFGLQQFSEGWVWLANQYEQFAYIKNLSSYSFLFFAWILWPSFVPYAFMGIERNPFRKRILRIFFYLGLIVSILLAYVIFFKSVESSILDCSIVYNFHINESIHKSFGIVYLAVTVLPTLISTSSKAWILGVLNLVAYFVTKIYISDRILSIWCFFAAISSMVILWIIIDYKKGQRD